MVNDCERKISNDLHALTAKFETFEKLMDERHDRYRERDDSRKVAVADALAAVKEQTSAAFLSSEKAIVKAEEAQKSYNERTNELRGTLDDQARMLLPRAEADARFQGFEEKVDDVKKQVAGLRESRSSGYGKDEATDAYRTLMKWLVGTAVTVLIFGFGAALTITMFLLQR
jgi:hypothetical protein